MVLSGLGSLRISTVDLNYFPKNFPPASLFVVCAPYLFAGYLPGERPGILGGEKRQGQMQPQRQAQENSSSLRIPDFGPDGLKGLSPEQIKKLQAGEVVMTSSPEVTPDGHSVIAAAVMFKVAVEQAWEILSATDRQIEYLEEIKKLTVEVYSYTLTSRAI